MFLKEELEFITKNKLKAYKPNIKFKWLQPPCANFEVNNEYGNYKVVLIKEQNANNDIVSRFYAVVNKDDNKDFRFFRIVN